MTVSGSQRPRDGSNSAVEDDPEFERIETALMETERGRRFLAAYARRHRGADTEMLLQAIARLESVVTQEHPRHGVDDGGLHGILTDLNGVAGAVAGLRAEIGEGATATEPFEAMLRAAEPTTSEILAAAEAVQEAAWTLREKGAEERLCDVLDRRAAEIVVTCATQERTAWRSLRIARTLSLMETRVAAMIAAVAQPDAHLPAPSPIPAEDEIAFATEAPVDAPPQPAEVLAEPGGPDRNDLSAAFADLDRLSIEEKIALFS